MLMKKHTQVNTNIKSKAGTELIFTAKTKDMAQWSLNVSLGVW